jgi:hypothetical protein
VGGQNMTFDIADFMQNSGSNCVFTFSFININSTGALKFNLEDMLLIGMQYFKKFSGIHFNYDTQKLSFLAPYKETIKPSPVVSPPS